MSANRPKTFYFGDAPNVALPEGFSFEAMSDEWVRVTDDRANQYYIGRMHDDSIHLFPALSDGSVDIYNTLRIS